MKAEYGEDEADKHVNLRFIADDILLPIEPMFRIPSSIESSLWNVIELLLDILSILRDVIEELDSEFTSVLKILVWGTLEKDILLPLAECLSRKSLSLSPFRDKSLITEVVLFAVGC